ncbi:metalloregulator ArsR/SmtB family transcription factor [Desulfovibrio sp. OttesenSCG-928-G15]|nr:metalloregulator ArsR/SmtB family transcription factor [Desulfovibrio sp. OttesenSCG-928-G15]
MFDFITVTKALTDENRVRILMALRDMEMCVCQITGFLDLSPSTTSKHLSILRQARLIESRKKGKWVYYTVGNITTASETVRQVVAWMSKALDDNPVVQEDRQRIREILAREESLCAKDPLMSDAYHSLAIHSLVDNTES